jgi:hypothetical protein
MELKTNSSLSKHLINGTNDRYDRCTSRPVGPPKVLMDERTD